MYKRQHNKPGMNKIPKIIHYCWLTDDESRPKPQIVTDCIASWHKAMPDYEIRCWGINDFDINSIPFVREACEAKKWAFASDYIRLHALYNYGGIYMDTDVITHKSFDPFLHHSAFSSIEFWPDLFFENMKKGSNAGLGILSAVLAAEPKHNWIKTFMDFYADKHFINTPEFMGSMINSGVIAEISAKHFNFKFIPIYQVLEGDIHLYPPDVFSRVYNTKDYANVTNYATHLCANSWRDATDSKPAGGFKNTLKYRIIGENNWNKIRKLLGK